MIEQIREHGGFTVFYASGNQRRAHAIERLLASGEIVRHEGGQFPWCRYSLGEKP